MDKLVNNKSYVTLLCFFITWMCVGIFPLICYEADSLVEILGCDISYSAGFSLPPIYTYEYRMQPLTVISILVLKNLIPLLTSEQIYCLLSALSSIVYLIGIIEFAHFITKRGKFIILLAAILLPETYAVSMYANSAIPAAACFIWALFCVVKKKFIIAGLLFVIAPLFRVDVLIVYPTIFPLLIHERYSFKSSIIRSSVFAILIMVITFPIFYLLKADVLSAFTSYQDWNSSIPLWQVLMAIFGFYSLTYILLMPIGLYNLYKNKKWKLMFLVIVPIVLLHIMYRSMGCASKHYLYISPFVIILGIYALESLSKLFANYKIARWVGLSFAIFVLFLSVRAIRPNREWLDGHKLFNHSIVTNLASLNISGCPIVVGIGAGQYLPTADELMLVSGHFFYPWYIHNHKMVREDYLAGQKESIKNKGNIDIITIKFGDWAPLASSLLSQKYRYSNKNILKGERTYGFTLSNDNQEINFWRKLKKTPDGEEETINDYIYMMKDQTEFDKSFFLATSPQFEMFLDKNDSVTKECEMFYRISK